MVHTFSHIHVLTNSIQIVNLFFQLLSRDMPWNLLASISVRAKLSVSRWWFQIFFIFISRGNDPNRRAYFSDGWEKNHQLGMNHIWVDPSPPECLYPRDLQFPNGRNVHDQKSRLPCYICPLLKIITPLGFKEWLFQVVYNLNLSIVLVYVECLGLRWMSTKHSSFGTPKEHSTLPKTNSSPLKNGGWNASFLSEFTGLPYVQVLCLLVSGSVTGKLWGDSKVYGKHEGLHSPPTSPRLSLTEQKQGDLRFVAWKVYKTWVGLLLMATRNLARNPPKGWC